MLIYTPRENQGQIIEVSYGYGEDGVAYRRTTDRSDGSIVWERGEVDWDTQPEQPDYEAAPCVDTWEPCSAPESEEL